jgi:hypothetical protein
MPESDDRTRPRPGGRLSLVTVTFQYPRERVHVLRAAAARRKQSVAELCRQAVDRSIAESADPDDP